MLSLGVSQHVYNSKSVKIWSQVGHRSCERILWQNKHPYCKNVCPFSLGIWKFQMPNKRLQVSLYANYYFYQLPIVSSAFKEGIIVKSWVLTQSIVETKAQKVMRYTNKNHKNSGGKRSNAKDGDLWQILVQNLPKSLYNFLLMMVLFLSDERVSNTSLKEHCRTVFLQKENKFLATGFVIHHH